MLVNPSSLALCQWSGLCQLQRATVLSQTSSLDAPLRSCVRSRFHDSCGSVPILPPLAGEPTRCRWQPECGPIAHCRGSSGWLIGAPWLATGGASCSKLARDDATTSLRLGRIKEIAESTLLGHGLQVLPGYWHCGRPARTRTQPKRRAAGRAPLHVGLWNIKPPTPLHTNTF
jgi:hypothetical protein